MDQIHSLSQLFQQERPTDANVAFRGDTDITWAHFAQRVTTLKQALQAHTATRWLLTADDAFAFATGLFALLHANKIPVLPPNAQEGTLQQLRTHAEALLSDHTAPPITPHLSLTHTAESNSGPQDTPKQWAPIAPSACIELFTSGSTGEPKRITKQWSQIASEVTAQKHMWKLPPHAFVCGTVSHQHIYGLLFRVCLPLAAGVPFESAPFLAPSHLHQQLQQRPETQAFVISTPAHLQRMMSWVTTEQIEHMAQQVRLFFSSGSPLPAPVAHQVAQALGQPPVEVFGSSETGGIAWRQQEPTLPEEAQRIWTPLSGVNVAFVPDTSNLRVRSPYTPAGPNTWYDTADRVEFVEDHTQPSRFVLLGRSDHIVKIAGKRVSLKEVEQKLCTHPWCAEAAVIVLPADEQITRERLGAIIVLHPEGQQQLQTHGKRATQQALRQALSAYFEAVALPRQWRFPQHIPEDAQGKRPLRDCLALFAQQPGQTS
jgi:acyl-coenzyme A synthetase/AMP-(fatty) acid ligase